MTLEKGWISRQCARIERDVQSWPEWMRREAELRAASMNEPVRPSPADTEYEREGRNPEVDRAGEPAR